MRCTKTYPPNRANSWMRGPPRALARSVTAAVMLPPTLSPATGEARGVQAVRWAVLCHPLYHGIVLLDGGGILGLGREAVVREDDGGLRADGPTPGAHT